LHCRGLIDGLVSGLMEGTVAAAAGLADVDAVRAHPGRVARFTPEAAKTSAQLKKFLRESVYESPALVRARSDSVSKIVALFELLLEHPDRMPAGYREESAGQPLHRQVCDYIAGMTDGFFLRTAAQLGVS
jgi:dGTPase